MNNEVDYAEAREFCQVVFGGQGIRLRAIPERPDLVGRTGVDSAGSVGAGAGQPFGHNSPKIKKLFDRPAEDMLLEAERLNKEGYAIYYLPQAFRAGEWKETYENIVGFRAVVVDMDGVDKAVIKRVVREEGCPAPTVIIESSEGHYQLVWKFTEQQDASFGVDAFNDLAFKLTALFEGDFNAARATQPFRLPGFLWQKERNGAEAFQSRIVYRGEAVDIQTLLDYVSIKEINDAARDRASGKRGWDGTDIDLASLRLGEIRVPTGDRHRAIIRLAVMLAEEGLDSGGIKGELDRILQESFDEPNDFLGTGNRRAELEKAVQDALGYREINRERDAARRELAERDKDAIADSLHRAAAIHERGRSGDCDGGRPGIPVDREGVLPEGTGCDGSGIQVGGCSRETGQGATTCNAAGLPEDGVRQGATEEDSRGTAGSGTGATSQFDFGKGTLGINKYADLAMAERLIQRYWRELLNVDGRVYCFSTFSKLWKPQADKIGGCNEVWSKAVEVIQEAVCEPDFLRLCCSDSRGRPSITIKRTAEQKMLSERFVKSTVHNVLSSESIRKRGAEDFDAGMGRLFCTNGVLDMDAPERGVRGARAEDMLIRRAGVDWCPDCSCAGWEKFVGEIFDGSEEMVSFIQELFGYSLSGSISEQRIFCHLGDGCNGKSKLLAGLREICGDYSTILEPDELVSKKGAWAKSFERLGAKVEGTRVVVVDDLDVNAVWNEGFVKVLTGERIRTRNLYSESRMVMNRSKFHIGLNVAPEPEAENKGLMRRVCLIPYNVTFEPSAVKERELSEMIKREGPGILRWAVEGYRRWIARGGLVYPAATQEALEDYQEEHFTLESTIMALFDCKVREGDSGAEWVKSSDIQEEVNSTLAARGVPERATAELLGRALKRTGCLQKKKWDKSTHNMARMYLLKRRYEKSDMAYTALV